MRTLLALPVLLTLLACERYDRLDRPFPEITATALDGTVIKPADLRGKPWVINVWVPG